MSETVAVIGAGSTGSSTAYQLVKSGFRVVLLDRGEIGYGMTSRSTAVVRTHYSNDIVARMALYSLKILRDFSSIGVSGFTNCGMLILVPDEFKNPVEQNVRMLRKAGVNEVELTKSEAITMFPDLDLEECDYFAFEPESGYADPVATAGAYATRARELGAEILLRKEVEKLEFEGGRVSSLLLQDGTKIKCSKVILCTNVWTNHLLERSGIPKERLLPIRAVPHPVVVYRRPSGYQGKRTIVSDYFNKAYFKPEGQSLLFGGSIDASIDNQSVDPDNPPGDVPFEYVSNYSETISKRIPAMKEAEFHSSYIGMYDITPDEHPIIDDLSTIGMGEVYSCVGLSGHGFKLCPAFGVMNTEMMLGKDPADLTFDRSYFALNRFRTGKLLSTRYEGLGSIG